MLFSLAVKSAMACFLAPAFMLLKSLLYGLKGTGLVKSCRMSW